MMPSSATLKSSPAKSAAVREPSPLFRGTARVQFRALPTRRGPLNRHTLGLFDCSFFEPWNASHRRQLSRGLESSMSHDRPLSVVP
ncbi:hypothetical protein AB1N83_002173 [Pleurotus pulmonarius]